MAHCESEAVARCGGRREMKKVRDDRKMVIASAVKRSAATQTAGLIAERASGWVLSGLPRRTVCSSQ
jgi:hypothetical protein